jgi:hypothetical protein
MKIASKARKIFDHHCKKFFATISTHCGGACAHAARQVTSGKLITPVPVPREES